MKTNQWKLASTRALFCAILIANLVGCGKNNNLNLQNPPPPPSTPVSIAFQPAPVASISLANTATFTAVVGNDSGNLGVDWSLLCTGNSDCGSLSLQGTQVPQQAGVTSLHSASGADVVYTPPSVISGNSQTFTIEAFATADNTKNIQSSLAVTGFASFLKGTYVFATKGIDANGPFQLAGVITLDGNGGITSGEQTHCDSLKSVADAITGGSYYVGADGRGTISITTGDQGIGQQGIENLSLVVLSNANALIATLDDPNLAPSFETSSGSLALQTSNNAPSDGYAFAVSGLEITGLPMAMGGILKIDSPGVISGSGSVADEYDAFTGTVIPNATVSGAVTNPDKFGSIQFNLNTSFSSVPIQFTGYIIDAQQIALIESDNTGSGAGFGSASGIAFGQGQATGTFLSNQAFAGTYVFGILGEDFSGLPTSMASVGEFTADASGNLSDGFTDEFVEGTPTTISDSFFGTYTLDPSGTGRLDSNISLSRHQSAPELIFYLTGNGNPPLMLSLDTTLTALGTGLANPLTATTTTFDGKYGFSFTQGATALENDAVGQITADAATGTLSGIVDTNLGFNVQPDSPLTGTFAPGTVTNRFSGNLTNIFFPTPSSTPNTLGMAFYMIDSARGYFIETDSTISGQLTFGYFNSRTAVCATCH